MHDALAMRVEVCEVCPDKEPRFGPPHDSELLGLDCRCSRSSLIRADAQDLIPDDGQQEKWLKLIIYADSVTEIKSPCCGESFGEEVRCIYIVAPPFGSR